MTRYYTLTPDDTLSPLSLPVKIGGAWRLHPTPAQAAQLGAYPRADDDVPPTPPEGKMAEPAGWETREGVWHRVWRIVDAPPPPPRVFSKLRLYGALAEAGLWERFEAWLKTQTISGRNGWTAFSLAQNITDDHPLFGPIFSAAKEALGMDDATAEAMLAAAEEGGA